MQATGIVQDSSKVVSTSTRQLNLVLPANGGAYIDATSTVLPYLGYSILGTPKAYTMFNGISNQFEYHQSSDAIPDFYINGGAKAVFNTGFLGLGTSTATTLFTGFAMKSNNSTWYGMYIDAGASGRPFYGYALNGVPAAYTQFNGVEGQYEYFQSNSSTPDFLVKGNSKAVFNTSFLGVGTSSPTTFFTGFALKSAANSYWGMYIDAGATGQPFYGYALNGVAKAYTQFNGTNNQFEYYHNSDASPDFLIGSTTAAFPVTTFLGVGTTTPTTSFTGFALKNSSNSYWGMYVDAGATGQPFYGYALNGQAKAYTVYNGTTNQFEYHHNSDFTPDFLISSNTAAFPATSFLGIGTTTPTTSFTGLALKSSSNSYWGMYIDAGTTGQPFYGYALDGVAKAYTQYNGTLNQFEYYQSSDASPDFYIKGNSKAVFNTAFVGIGTSTPTTGADALTIKTSAAGYFGMYIDAGVSGLPFYGYAINGLAKAWTNLNGNTNNWELNYNGTQIVVTPAGNVGIGTTLPTQKLDVNGTIHALNLNGGATSLSTDASGNIIRTPSDARLKCGITDIDRPLEKVLKLRGVTYNFIDTQRFGTDRQMGFLAQDLEKVVPETVSSGGEYKSVNYQEITALLTEAIKEQQRIITELKDRIEVLESNQK
ncbi:MAG: tail fiber domain-containing protein [Bacteroidales bacterium]|nr:tail fiber domain-containing protein [Bacteroidales bacterium]